MKPAPCPDCGSLDVRLRLKVARWNPAEVRRRTRWLLCYCRACPAVWVKAKERMGRVVCGRMG